jgi:hypothetical protein
MVFVSAGCTQPVQDERQAFRSIPWGTTIDQLKGMVPLAGEGDLQFFQRQDDALQFHGVECDRLVYGFHKNRFYSVTVHLSSEPRYQAFKDALLGTYGPPDDVSDSMNRYFWQRDQLHVLLSYDGNTRVGRVFYSFQPIARELE